MKKYYILLLSIITATFTIQAQKLTWDLDTAFVSDTEKTGFVDIYAHAEITNDSLDNDTFVWIRQYNNLSTGWESAVCDINLCWGTDTDSAEFILPKGQTGAFEFHFYPEGCGNGEMQVYIVNKGDRSQFASIISVGNVWCLSNDKVDIEQFKIAPNPVKNDLTLIVPDAASSNFDNNVTIDIINLLGQKVISTPYAGGKPIDVSDLNNGIYFLKFKLQDKTYTKKFQVNR